MKPWNWEQMRRPEKLRFAGDLLGTHRGKYVVSLALAMVVEKCDVSHLHLLDRATVEDMEVLRETIYDQFDSSPMRSINPSPALAERTPPGPATLQRN